MEAIKDKKKLYRAWVRPKLEEDYIKYRLARRHCKRVMKEAIEESWKTYGEQLSELRRHSPRNLYKSMKAMTMRDETYDPTTIIIDQNSNPINDKNDIKTRWKEYFNELSSNTQKSLQTQFQFHPSYEDNDEEPIILRFGVQQAIKTSHKNKSPRIYGITTEAILASGEIGVTWLTSIFQKGMEWKKSPRLLAASSHSTNMEEERQQKRLWNVQRHLPTEPRGQNACQSPGTTNKVHSRTIPSQARQRWVSEKEGAAQKQFSPPDNWAKK